jgi:hypothetical protein
VRETTMARSAERDKDFVSSDRVLRDIAASI